MYEYTYFINRMHTHMFVCLLLASNNENEGELYFAVYA